MCNYKGGFWFAFLYSWDSLFLKKMMIELKNISVEVEGKRVLSDVSLKFESGKNYCLLGKNGSGKSSLALSVMGHPSYQLVWGDIFIDGENVSEMSPDERAQKGIFLAFQTIPEIAGVKLFEFLRTIYSTKHGKQESFLSFKRIIEPLLVELGIDKEFLRRDLNVGFSWGEKRKIEILQIKLLQPRTIFLDEVDSGLDVDAFKSVAQMMNAYNSPENSFIVITHYFSILDFIPVDWVFVLQEGKLVKEWLVDLVHSVKESGFSAL